jgi:hypothetical protein
MAVGKGEQQYLEKIRPIVTMPTTNSTLFDVGSNLDCRYVKPATNQQRELWHSLEESTLSTLLFRT